VPPVPKEKEPIKIGHIAPLTGSVSMYGEWEKDGIELAIEEINAKGGINGKKIIVIHEDSKAEPATGVTALNKLITIDKVPVIIGAAASSVTLACAPIAERNKVVLLSAVSAAIKISDAGDYIFRIFPSNAQEGEKLVKLAKKLEYKDAGIIYINNDFGSELAEVVKAKATDNDIKIVAVEGYSQDATDFRTQLIKIKDKAPAAVFLLGYPKDMALVLKQAKELGIDTQFLAPDTFDAPEILESAGEAAEGVIYTLPKEDVPESFREKFKEKYNKEPNVVNALAYDALYLIALAIEKGGYKGEGIKDALYQIKDFPGVTGNITFDEKGDAIDRPLALKTVKNGQFVPYED
jgi:branched-chain amino acid transport system substrate-binding protein